MIINGTKVAEPSLSGVVVTDEPVWSSDTGRNIRGKMTGHIIDFKTTVEVTWALLTYDELIKIRNAIVSGMRKDNAGFFTIVYPEADEQGNLSQTSKVVYAGNVPRTLYSTNAKAQFYTDITVTFIER